MAQRYLGIGNGKDGVVALGSYTPLKYTCSGTSGASSLTATGTIAAGDRLFIIQSRGTGVGAYEDNRVASYTTGTVTLVHPLENTYTDSGASQAQVLIVKEASEVTGSLTVDAWDGNDGGVFAIACSGVFSGTVTASAKGFRGGATANDAAQYGEGGPGAAATTSNADNNGNGGGGGVHGAYNSPNLDIRGAGGGNGTAGGDGAGGNTAIEGGDADGNASLTDMVFGGGGGGAAGQPNVPTNTGGAGSAGGGIIVVYAGTINSSASLVSDGATGGSGVSQGNPDAAGGGGGAGGSILVKAKTVDASGTITAALGAGGDGGLDSDGAAGAVGRIRIESCSVSGTTSPSASESTGGHNYCGGGIFLI
jgi:large repetitive protein